MDKEKLLLKPKSALSYSCLTITCCIAIIVRISMPRAHMFIWLACYEKNLVLLLIIFNKTMQEESLNSPIID